MLHKFYFDAQTRARAYRERYGQAMFNHLSEVRPELAELVRGTDKDPFHVERLSHPNWDRFVLWLESEWYKELTHHVQQAPMDRGRSPAEVPAG